VAAGKKIGQLLEGEYAAIGSPSAPVIVVVFSDFQCQYCKKLWALLPAEPLITRGDKIRLIFRHMPGPQHEWADRAAEAAACAQLQSCNAFWQLHNAFFENQETITAANVDNKTEEFSSKIGSLDLGSLKGCLNNHKVFRHGSSRSATRRDSRREGNADPDHRWETLGRTAKLDRTSRAADSLD